MKENSRIRFNPVTKEIEVEGSEEFVRVYFEKLQAMLSASSEKPITKKKEKAVKAPAAKKARKTAKKSATKKKVTNIDAVISLIQASVEGISTIELKEKAGLADRQIWSIVNRAAKEGKIRKVKRGVYGAVIE